MAWDYVSNTRSRVPDDSASISCPGVASLGVVRAGGGGRLRDAENVGPLQDLLRVVVIVEDVVSVRVSIISEIESIFADVRSSVPEHHAWTRTSVAGVGGPDKIALRKAYRY